MKLKAGQKYLLQNGIIEKCLAVWCEKYQGYQATMTRNGDGATHTSYTLCGKYFPYGGIDSELDVVAEYREPVKFKRWIHLYDDGTIDVEGDERIIASGFVESRKIEWEAPDNG